MDENKLVSALNDGRLINAAEQVIFPMIQTMIQIRVFQCIGKFQNGEKDFVGDVAYIAGLREIENELKTKQTRGAKAYDKIHGQEESERPEIIIPKNI